jgi:hypothetical protein
LTAENKRLNRLHNDPEHLKEMIETKGRYRCSNRRYTEEDEDPAGSEKNFT